MLPLKCTSLLIYYLIIQLRKHSPDKKHYSTKSLAKSINNRFRKEITKLSISNQTLKITAIGTIDCVPHTQSLKKNFNKKSLPGSAEDASNMTSELLVNTILGLNAWVQVGNPIVGFLSKLSKIARSKGRLQT